MKPSKTVRKTIPAIHGLYYQTTDVYKEPVKAPDRNPTYHMDTDRFKKFVSEIEKLATQAEKIFKNGRQEFKFHNGILVNYSVSYGLGPGNWAEFKHNVEMQDNGVWRIFFDDYKKFRKRYKDFFSLVSIQHNGHEYFNLDFWPRKKGFPQTLFTAFSNALFTIHGITRLKKGREKRTAAITPAEWKVVESLRSKHRGTERGSNKFCAEEIRESRGASPKADPALRRAIYREEHRRKK